MPTPTIHELRDSFDDRNVCLNVVLGMISLLRRFKEVVRDYGSPDPVLDHDGDRESPFQESALLYGALGLISFSASMMRHLDAAKADASGLRPKQASAGSPEREDRLRMRELLR